MLFVQVGATVTKAIGDAGGGKSMIDLTTAQRMGLKVEFTVYHGELSLLLAGGKGQTIW